MLDSWDFINSQRTVKGCHGEQGNMEETDCDFINGAPKVGGGAIELKVL